MSLGEGRGPEDRTACVLDIGLCRYDVSFKYRLILQLGLSTVLL